MASNSVDHTNCQHRSGIDFFGLLVITVYVFCRMIGDFFFWRYLPFYYAYLFEFVFVFAAWLKYRRHIRLFQKPSVRDGRDILFAMISGFAVFSAAIELNIGVPFDFTSRSTVFLVLFLGPVLEEAIFRMAIWGALFSLIRTEGIVLALTTAFFAAGHFSAFWFVPDELKSFILYQTIYVLLLGFGAGWVRMKSKALSPAIAIHFGFNFGFYLGSVAYG